MRHFILKLVIHFSGRNFLESRCIIKSQNKGLKTTTTKASLKVVCRTLWMLSNNIQRGQCNKKAWMCRTELSSLVFFSMVWSQESWQRKATSFWGHEGFTYLKGKDQDWLFEENLEKCKCLLQRFFSPSSRMAELLMNATFIYWKTLIKMDWIWNPCSAEEKKPFHEVNCLIYARAGLSYFKRTKML